MVRAVDELEESTQMYWELASIRNGTIERKMNVQQGIDAIHSLEARVGPHRRLASCVHVLAWDIISNARRKKKGPQAPIHVLTVIARS
jgi:hypothetical protein